MIMGAIFFIALILYFYRAYHSMERENTVYSVMDEPTLPVAYVSANGYLMNPMHAYLQDMGNKAARDMITVLPENRQLELVVQEYDNMVASASYEIRTLDLGHLIERGTVSDISREGGSASICLPIQNLINKDQAYLLHITLDTGAHTLNYYTRILWTDHDYTKSMEDIAFTFTRGSFDKSAGKEITTYLESNESTSNSDFGHVTLQSSFDQITWGDTGMQAKGTFYMTLKEFDGVMGEVQISYESYRTDEDGNEQDFLNEDNFVFRNDAERVYMMDFDRRTRQIFDGSSDEFDGKHILLGVGSTDDIAVRKSENENYIAFKTSQGLWLYDQSKNGRAINIFSYRSNQDDGVRSNYDQHDIKILSVSDKGDVDFLVYGYVNRGSHEGNNGILYYRYDRGNDTVTENFFIGIPEVFEKIRWNLDKLSYLSSDGMLYLCYSGSVYGIDTNSLELVTVASGLQETEFVSSENQQYIAYQDANAEDRYHAGKITLVNLEGNQSAEIHEDNAYLRVLGFNGDDLIYGVIDPAYADQPTEKGDVPIREIHIADSALQDKTSYEKEGQLFYDISVSGTRIHFDKLTVKEDGSYQAAGEDTIISNREESDSTLSGVDTYTDAALKKCLCIAIKDIGSRQIQSYAPKNLSLERASSIDLRIVSGEATASQFYAYAHGHFRAVTQTLEEAYNLVYDDFGYVMTEDGELVWNRADKSTMVTLKNPTALAEDALQKLSELRTIGIYNDYIMVNAFGMDLGSALYYLNKGYPLIAYLQNGCYLIYSYDSFNIRLVDPESGTQNTMGRSDAETMFRQDGNRFVGIVPHKT